MAGVTVTLHGPGAAQIMSTAANGEFHFLHLSPGAYSVTLERSGFETVRRDVAVALGKNAVIAATLSVAGAQEAVTIGGPSPAVDTRTTETGASFSRSELDAIPTTRDPWGMLRQVPGVLLGNMDVGSAQSTQQPTFIGKGTHPDQNTYNLDGVGVSIGGATPLYFDFDSLDSIEVATGGSDLSLSTPGVTLNLVTKRGTNQLLGSARVLYTGGAKWDYGAEAGGPLWKDRVWLWAAGASNSFLGQTFILPDGEATRSQEAQKYWNAKLNAAAVPSNTLTLSFTSFERDAEGRGAAPDRSQPSTWDQTFPSQSLKVEDSQVLSPTLFASAYFSYLKTRLTNTPQGGVAEQADSDVNGVWRNSYNFHRFGLPQHQVGATTSTFFDMATLQHELKFGFGYRHATLDSMTVWPGDELVGYANSDGPLASITRASNQHLLFNYYDTYLGDTIRAGNLTVNAGVRFDYQQGRNLPSSVPANPVFPDRLPAVQYGGDSGYPVTWRMVQPRVGATYTVGRDHTTLLRASYARFSNQLSNEIATINAFPGSTGLYYSWNDANGNGRVEPNEVGDFQFPQSVNPDDPGSAVPVNQISRSLKPPTTDEFIVGVEGQIFSKVSASLAYTHRSTHNLEFSPLIGTTRSSYQYLGNAAGIAEANSNGFVLDFSVPYYGLTTDPPPVGSELQNRPDASETYSGVELQLLKPFSHGWMARVSFAYNDWQQHIGPGAIVDPNNITPGTNTNGPVVESGINATWQFNVSGTVLLPWEIAAGMNVFGRQGFPIPYYVEVITNDPSGSRPDVQIGQATQYRTPNVYEVDLQLSRAFRIGPHVTVIPQFDCFNLLNSHTVLQRDGLVGFYDAKASPAFDTDPEQFNAVAEVLSSRTFRGGVRILF